MNRLLKILFRSSYFDIYDTFIENSDGRAASRRNIVWGNSFARIVSAMTDGIYFTSLMLAMGAGEIFIGYVTAALTFCGFFQFFSPLILSRFPRRKNLLIASRAFFHFMNIVVMGGLPLLPLSNGLKLGLFVAALMLKNISSNLMSPGLSDWHRQNIPNQKLIGYTSLDDMAAYIVSHVSAFLAGVFLDHFELNQITMGNIPPTLLAIVLLRAGALVLAVFECVKFAKVAEDPHETADGTSKNPPLKLLLQPLKNKAFMTHISIPMMWSLSTTIVGSFFSIYVINDVQLSYSLISLSQLISTPLRLIAVPTWSKLLRKHNWGKMLMIAQLGTAFAYVLNSLVTGAVPWLYVICMTCGAVFGPGISLNHTRLLYAQMPTENRISYISLYSVIIQIITFIGHNIGIWIVQFSGDLRLPIFGLDMCSKQYVNLVQAVLIVLACVYTWRFSRKNQIMF